VNLARLVVGGAAQILELGPVERTLRAVLVQVETALEDGLLAFLADDSTLRQL
jgi:hypothetical protein